jgi:hypothetical protein
MGHVIYINESCDILGMSHGRVLREEEWFIELVQVWRVMSHVMSHIWMRRVTHMNESCHTYDGTCVTRKGLLNAYSNSFLVVGAGSLAPAAITLYPFTMYRYTNTRTRTHTHAHTHTHSLSHTHTLTLSLSLTHTHTHVHIHTPPAHHTHKPNNMVHRRQSWWVSHLTLSRTNDLCHG